MFLALLIAAQTYGPQHLPPVIDAEDPLVDAAGLVPGLIVDLAYATADNIAGRALYPPDAKCLLRRSVAQRLAIAADALRDRKSTRLNSSHLVISYAVFCLKKKKKIKTSNQ